MLRAIRPIDPEHLHHHAARGQYGPGWIEGENVTGYRSEPDVAPDSVTETFAALKLFVDNWRWQDIPFYLRTGKRLRRKFRRLSSNSARSRTRPFPASANLTGSQQPGNPYPARRRHRPALPGQAAGGDAESEHSGDALSLCGSLPYLPTRGLRNPAVGRHVRRCHPIYA